MAGQGQHRAPRVKDEEFNCSCPPEGQGGRIVGESAEVCDSILAELPRIVRFT